MKRTSNLAVVTVLSLFCSCAIAQGVLQIEAGIPMQNVPKQLDDTLKGSISTAWAAFVADASLFNPASGEIDDRSMERFKRHFAFNAKVINDLTISPSLINYSDYVSQAYRRLRKEGIRCWFEPARLTNISYDAAGFYKAEIEVNKMLSNGIDLPPDSKKGSMPGPRCFNLMVRMEIPENNLAEALITNINGTPCKEISQAGYDTEPRLAVFGQVLLPTFKFENTDKRIDERFTTATADPVIAGGVYLQNKFTPKSRIGYGIGLFATKYNLTLSTSKAKVDTLSTIKDQLAVSEAIRISYFEIPIGIHISLMDKEKLSILMDITGTTSIRGKLDSFKRTYSLRHPTIDSASVNLPPADHWTFFSLGVGLSLHYKFSDKAGLLLGANYRGGISPVFAHQPSDQSFLDHPERLGNPGFKMIENYFSNIKMNALGIHLGISFNLNKEQ